MTQPEIIQKLKEYSHHYRHRMYAREPIAEEFWDLIEALEVPGTQREQPPQLYSDDIHDRPVPFEID
jgi:hypothetical protein